jgi:hypothetical protein
MVKLNKRQRAILSRMCSRDNERDGAESGVEMAEAIWRSQPGIFTSLEQGRRSAKQLVDKGLAKELGFTGTGARCVVPTDEGRAALAATS